MTAPVSIGAAGSLIRWMKMMVKHARWVVVLTLTALTVCVSAPHAKNFVDWKGGFWLTFPDNWEKVDYRIVDQYLYMTDTSQQVFNYEAVYAPKESQVFAEEAYLVIAFDSTGPLTPRQTDSVLESIAASYSAVIDDAWIVQYMSDLVPGRPQIDRTEKTVSVLSEMAYSPEAMRKLYLYMRLNSVGLISLFCYSPDSTFERNKPIFDSIIKSLSFENLKEASKEELVFTDVGGGDGSGAGFSSETGKSSGWRIIPYLVLIAVAVFLVWRIVIAPRMKKTKAPSA